MSDKTGIEWTDATWNPVTGCTEVSPGCDHCYAKTFAERWRGTPGHYFEQGFDVQLRPDKLDLPLKWRKPRKVFVNSMSDLFHDSVPDDYIAQVWGVMAWSPHHTFQILTKRHARMRSLLSTPAFKSLVDDAWYDIARRYPQGERKIAHPGHPYDRWPLPNVWLGVSAENQQWADIRIPALLGTSAAVRFISAEPLLGPIDLLGDADTPGPAVVRTGVQTRPNTPHGPAEYDYDDQIGIDWVIAGGESGHGARPMHPDWARSLRDQCTEAGVAFLFKQWGEWMPIGPDELHAERPEVYLDAVPARARTTPIAIGPALRHLVRVGKGKAGRILDGRTWDEYPEVAS